MSVKVRPYKRGGWEVDIRVRLANGKMHRERTRSSASSRTAASRFGKRVSGTAYTFSDTRSAHTLRCGERPHARFRNWRVIRIWRPPSGTCTCLQLRSPRRFGCWMEADMLQVFQHRHKVPQIATQPIQPPAHEHIEPPALRVLEQGVEGGAPVLAPDTPRSTNSVPVQPRALTYRRSSCSWFSGSCSTVLTRA
jgi:hypothetical protein